MYCRKNTWIDCSNWRTGEAYKKCIHCGRVTRYNRNKGLSDDHRPDFDPFN